MKGVGSPPGPGVVVQAINGAASPVLQQDINCGFVLFWGRFLALVHPISTPTRQPSVGAFFVLDIPRSFKCNLYHHPIYLLCLACSALFTNLGEDFNIFPTKSFIIPLLPMPMVFSQSLFLWSHR